MARKHDTSFSDKCGQESVSSTEQPTRRTAFAGLRESTLTVRPEVLHKLDQRFDSLRHVNPTRHLIRRYVISRGCTLWGCYCPGGAGISALLMRNG